MRALGTGALGARGGRAPVGCAGRKGARGVAGSLRGARVDARDAGRGTRRATQCRGAGTSVGTWGHAGSAGGDTRRWGATQGAWRKRAAQSRARHGAAQARGLGVPMRTWACWLGQQAVHLVHSACLTQF